MTESTLIVNAAPLGGAARLPMRLALVLGALLLSLSLVILPLAGSAHAAPRGTAAKAYEDARSYYLSLSQRDPKVTDLMEWERAASFLLDFVRAYDDPNYAARATHLLGRLYEHMFLERQYRTGLTRAVYFYEQVAKQYRGHPLADDALLYLGDLRRNALKDEVGARAAYYEIIDVYPDGDMYAKARARVGPEDRPQKTAKAEPPREAAAKKATPTSAAAVPTPAAEATVLPTEPTEPEEEAATEEEAAEDKGGLLSLFRRGPSVGEEGKEIFTADQSRRRPTIVIDPGHGGTEDGAHGVDDVLEKDVVLSISLMLDELLRERLRARTVLTRTSDVHVPLPDRTQIANDHEADLFISIHANASEFKNAHGIETYYLDNTNDRSSLRLAERENASYPMKDAGDLSFILSDLIQSGKLDDSISLAHHIQDSLHGNISRYYKGVKNLGVKKAPFFVLVGAHMPCVLVEVSFIDHPVEGRRLISKRYQKLVAAALYEGVREYFEKR